MGKTWGKPGENPGKTEENWGKPGKTGENRGKLGKTGENRGKPGKTGENPFSITLCWHPKDLPPDRYDLLTVNQELWPYGSLPLLSVSLASKMESFDVFLFSQNSLFI